MSSLSINELLQMKTPAVGLPPRLSPDGRWLSVTLSSSKPQTDSKGVSSENAGCSQWLYDLRHKRSFRIIPDAHCSSWAGVWSPNGNTLAFYCDLDGEAGLWIWSEETGARRVGECVARPFHSFEHPVWTHDGTALILKAMPSEKVDESVFGPPSMESCGIDPISVYRTGTGRTGDSNALPLTFVNRYRADIVQANTVTGEVQVLVEGLHPLEMKISPDGTTLAFASAAGQDSMSSQQLNYDLWVTPIQFPLNGSPRRIARGVKMEHPTFAWADDRTVMYTTSGPIADGGLWEVSVETGMSAPIRLASSEKVRFHSHCPPIPLRDGDVLVLGRRRLWRYCRQTGEITQVAPGWDRHVMSVVSAPGIKDDTCVIVQTHEPSEMLSGFYRVDLLSGKQECMLEQPRKIYCFMFGGATVGRVDDKEKLLYFAESENEPVFASVLGIESKRTEQAWEFNPDISSEHRSSVKLLQWQLGDLHLKGVLMLPSEVNGPVPVIVRVYAGDRTSEQLRYFGCSPYSIENNHLLTSQGYAVFLPEVPVSGDEPADAIARGLDAAMQALVSRAEIDSERIGMIGHSFGGYNTMVALTRLCWFKAAVVSAGFANLISKATHFDPRAQDYFLDMWKAGSLGFKRRFGKILKSTCAIPRSSNLTAFRRLFSSCKGRKMRFARPMRGRCMLRFADWAKPLNSCCITGKAIPRWNGRKRTRRIISGES